MVITLAIGAISPMRAQDTGDAAVEQTRSAEATSPHDRTVETSKSVRVHQPRAERAAISTLTPYTHGDDARPIEAKSRAGCLDGAGSRELADAIETLGTNVTSFDDCAKLYRRLGDAHAAAGHTRRAIASYEKSVVLDPDDDTAQAALVTLWNLEAVRRSSPQTERRW